MEKTATSHKPGDIVKLAGIEFVVLDPNYECPNGEDGIFILAKDAQGESVFGDNNNYAESALRTATNKWYDELKEWSDEDYIFPRRIDMTTMDGHGHYGFMITQAAPLTMDEARQYADIIPNPDIPCWLATGWGGPGYYGSTFAWFVGTDGSGDYNLCSYSYGIRPALVVSSFLLDSEEEAETNDLSQVPTEDLLAEIRRRIGEDE